MHSYRVSLKDRPRTLSDGDEIYLPKRLVEKNHEIAVTVALMCNRKLFGASYRSLMPSTYRGLGRHSGVMIGMCVPSAHIIPELTFPGDIDLLVIPYDDDQLLVSETLAIEVKVVRAKYSKQGKAPNEFGFSQAKAILAAGFPYSAVAHLIVSDNSPVSAWEGLMAAKVLDVETGRLRIFESIRVDTMPSNLISRSFGRLQANCTHKSLGLLAAHISFDSGGFWSPLTKPAEKNTRVSSVALNSIAEFYAKNFRQFMDTPKY